MDSQAGCALGLAPHSGWAAAVLVGGTPAAPRVLARERVELTDPQLPGSKQPYHALAGRTLAEAGDQLERFRASAATLARQGLAALVDRARAAPPVRVAGILDASGRGGTTLEAILASHAFIHTADGDHFRAALAQACAALGLEVVRIPQRSLSERASARLGKSPAELATTVTALGRSLGAPWGADQKSAALLAWWVLAGGARSGSSRQPA